MPASKKIFRQTVLASFLPVLHAKGFERWEPNARGGDAPVIHLRRQVRKRRDLLALQFDKYGRLCCFLNLAQIEGEKISTMYEGLPRADEITTAHLSDRCRLHGNSLSGVFKAPLHIRVLGPERSGKAVANQIAARFCEAEDWFATKRVGKHIKCYKL